MPNAADSPDIFGPSFISPSCSNNAEVGFAGFNLAGKTMRCINQTLENIFSGKIQQINRDSTGNIIYNANNNISFTEQCRDGTSPVNGVCSSSLFNNVQAILTNTVVTFLTMFIAFLGLRVIMNLGGGFAVKDVFLWTIKIGFIMYFVLGNAWNDRYY